MSFRWACAACMGQGFWQVWDGEGYVTGTCGECEGTGTIGEL